MTKRKTNSTYLGRHVRLSVGTYDEILGLKENGDYDSAEEVIHEAVASLKVKKKKARPDLLKTLGG